MHIRRIFGHHYSTVTKVTQCQLINNEASGDGGATYMEMVTTRSTTGNISVTSCQFMNNMAGGSGGAMYKLEATTA